MSHQLPARAARWPLSRAPLGGDRRRWLARARRAGRLARARRAGLDEASIEASYRDAFLARTKEETL